MDISSKAIVLKVIKYNDNYNIVDLYTKELGRCAIMVSIPKSTKSRNKNNYYQPLFLLDLVLSRKKSTGLFKVRDVRFDIPFSSLPYNHSKITIAFFIAEFIVNVVGDGESSDHLFDYLYNSILWLDTCSKGFANFHLVFLMHLPLFLGLYPNLSDYKKGDYFDLLNASFTSQKPINHAHYLDVDESDKIVTLMRMNYDTMHLFKLNRDERSQILLSIYRYYKLHIPNLIDLKSLDVLKELFD